MNSPIDSVLTSDAAEQYRNEKYRTTSDYDSINKWKTSF